LDDISSHLKGASELFKTLGEDGMADLLDGLSGAADGLKNVFKILDENTSTGDAISTGIGAAINLGNILISSAARRRQAEEKYYNSVISQQKEYNRLLNEQILTQEGVYDNVFTKDYIQEIENGLNALKGASKGFNDSLKELSEGRA